MKVQFATVAVAALAGSAGATVHHRHAHDIFRRNYDNATCTPECTTYWTTWYGEATLHNPSPPSAPATTSSVAPVTTAAPPTSTKVIAVVPTPVAQTCSTTGVYTFPATTITLNETTTVCAPSSTKVPSGTYTLGGVTTVVTNATTIVCPYPTVSTSEGVTTSVIETTTYVCPSAGTYTIAPTTTTVYNETTVVVPVISTYPPGTYTQPEVVTTVTETNTVIYCPFDELTTAVTSSPAEVTSSAPAEVPTTTSVPVEATTSSAVVYPSSSATQSATSSAAKPSSTLGGSGNGPWGLTYTPYDTAGSCKSKSDVDSDIALIAAAGITTIRVYSTDCDTLPNVGDACSKHGVKMVLGIFIDAPHCSANNPTVAEQISAIKSWAQYDIVELIVVGNEAVFNGYCSASELASLISECRSEFSGYSGPFTTADIVTIWEDSSVTSVLCDVIDVVGCNSHAFFNTETVASQAGEFVKGQLAIVNQACPGKPAKVLETGWPSAGNCMGKACPGLVEQAIAVASLVTEVGADSILFSYTDDAWKDGSTECGCEQHWGCASALGL
ncbi:glycoside hydrolase superfamily [Pseudomassariella vexata]|uniref:Probable beta-glucosidase btgE n=1 Tax=Pseudomassariella vexata TaxID=1141098 RepID=A0A1Y2E492_9PEZI|nr:glycoside hydrolase superfamily [Pseudomassariella vexata]ORY66378.1 glycoside hydrolase superfamily [Pseudomassariella vexata]